MQSARQLRSIVVAAYPEFERLSQRQYLYDEQCDNSASDVEELACRWREAMHVMGSQDKADSAVQESLVRVFLLGYATLRPKANIRGSCADATSKYFREWPAIMT